MKIITQGQLPSQQVYRAICQSCKTLFEFLHSESEPPLFPDQHPPGARLIPCPLLGCHTECLVTDGNIQKIPPPSLFFKPGFR
jgi:hypothetical protein